MGRGVLLRLNQIVPPSHDSVARHDDCADRHLLSFQRLSCLVYCHAHEFFIALLLCYVKLTGRSDNVSSIKREISALEEEHVALLTTYECTFDLATVKAAAEAAGMSKPSSGQIQYIDLSGADSVEVYAAGGAAALNGFTEKAESLWAYVLEYFR